VVSGPNGSGKSNILDALLFALGLSSSKGMRAERLPDLVNQTHSKKGRTVEAIVTVTFALDDQEVAGVKTLAEGDASPDPIDASSSEPETDPEAAKDWTVTRKLRVTGQGTYTSTYYINGVACTLTDLHEQLARLRIYPEGYNVVLQGDVTGVISMNSRDRREIIDELAGVGEFDRKITNAKEKLDEVKAQEDRFRIVEQELIATQEKLKGDRIKAEKYQKLRQELDTLLVSEVVLEQRQLLFQKSVRETELANNQQAATDIRSQLAELATTIATTTQQLEQLNIKVRSLGEEEQISLSTEIATKNAELRATQRQQQDLTNNYQNNQNGIVATQAEIDQLLQQIEQLSNQKQTQEQEAEVLAQARGQQAGVVAQCRQELQSVAASSAEWVNQQGQVRQTIDAIQESIAPQKQEQARLSESLRQWSLQLAAQETELAELQEKTGRSLEDEITIAQAEVNGAQSLIQSSAMSLSEAQMDVQTARETIERLTQEQRLKSRQLDKLEAQTQANQEVQGTRATKVIMEADLSGVYGMVAQLGWVEPRFQLALEISAGNRLSFLVVDSDEVAAEAINLLKLERAGRATFLPLTKMKSSRKLNVAEANRSGAIDYAINLIEFEDRYQDVFAFVFGNTLVFEHLEQARSQIGKFRMVTLEGDILETSGAMTGGSAPMHSGIHFGNAAPGESIEVKQLRERLMEIDHMLNRLNQKMRMTQTSIVKYEEQLQNARIAQREAQIRSDLAQGQIGRNTIDRDRINQQIQQNRASIEVANAQIASIEASITELEAQLQVARSQMAEVEQSSTHTRWQQIQETLQTQEQQLSTMELSLRTVRSKLESIETQSQLILEKISQRQLRLQEFRSGQTDLLNRSAQAQTQARQTEAQIEQLQTKLNQIEQTLGTTKAERDAVDRTLRTHQSQQQQLEWQLQKNIEKQTELNQQIVQLALQIAQIELPDPLPVVPEDMTLEQLQMETRRLQKRIQAMEPVNMMAIVEYDSTTTRLTELSGRLETLSQERTELLLRIENFTTLRQRAFMEAFDAVNHHFQEIFAELSDGDGYLKLENPTAPLSGGLTLVAHPKGKPVQHLASMSGGEKSLTALSFIFALQRYRPSPFYAFDEVDMFLDGSNVERLSKMVRKQADLAQFIVVSLRRPMIEAAERTIGVTQSRGAHTQVLGMELRSS